MSVMSDNETEARRSVLLPPGWLDRIRRLAQASRRSVHAEMLWLIERGLEAEEHPAGEPDDPQDRR